MRTQTRYRLVSSGGLVMYGVEDTRIIAIAGFFLMLYGSCSRAPVFSLFPLSAGIERDYKSTHVLCCS